MSGNGLKHRHIKKLTSKGIESTDELDEAFSELTVLQQDIAIGHLMGITHLQAYNGSKGKAKTDEAKFVGVNEILKNPKGTGQMPTPKVVSIYPKPSI